MKEHTDEQGVAVADEHVVEEQQGQAHDETEEGREQSHDSLHVMCWRNILDYAEV